MDRKFAVGTEGPAGGGIGERGASEPFGRSPRGSDRKTVGVVGGDELKSCLGALRGLGCTMVWDRGRL